MTIKCVLFDLDGTLLDTSYDFSYALNLLSDECNVPAPSYQQVRNTVSQGGAAVTRLAFAKDDEANFEAKRQRFLQIYLENIALHTQIFPGLQPGLVELADKNIPWGIVTNKPTDLTLALLNHFSFPSPPKTVICGDTLSVRKPNPEPMWLAAEQCGVPPAQCLYLGDHPRDIEAGMNAGMQTGAALFGYLAADQINNLGQANHVFRTPYDITKFLKACFN